MNLISLEYFNSSGKFVGSGQYSTKLELDYEIRDEIILINELEDLPGLYGGLAGTIYVKCIYGDTELPPMIVRV